MNNQHQPPAQATATAEKPRHHYFSLEFAVKHGVPEAIVAKFIAHKVRCSKNVRNDKKWFFDPIRELAGRYPYIPKSTMDKILKRMETKKLIEIDSFNRRGYDRTGWYTMSLETMDAVEKGKRITVDVRVAAEFGIPAGVLIENLRFWINKKAEKRKQGDTTTIYHEMSPARLAIDLPCFDLSTIKRALKALAESPAPHIVKHPTLKATYTLPEMVQDGGAGRDKAGSKRDMGGSERDTPGPERDEGGSKRDNNTHYKPLSNPVDNSVGKPFKEEAQASPAPACESNSGRTDDKILAKGTASPQDGHPDSPSSPDIKGCAGHVKDSGGKRDAGDEMTDPLTYEQLKAINKERDAVFIFKDPDRGIYDQPNDPASVSALIVRNVSWPFVHSLSNDTVRRFKSITGMDQLVAEVRTLFLPHFQSAYQQYDQDKFPSFKALKPTFFRVSLEFVVNSIAALRDRDAFCCHSIENLSPFIYDLMLVMFGRLYRENDKLLRERYEDRKRELASVDVAKESDPDLAPAAKARVLRNALQARNSWGYIDDTGEFVDKGVVVYSPADLDTAEKLFELNRGFCAGQLLEVIDKCVETHIYGVAPGKEVWDENFHVRQGYKLGFFLKHAAKITEELGSTVLNGWTPLPTEVEEKAEEPAAVEPDQDAGA